VLGRTPDAPGWIYLDQPLSILAITQTQVTNAFLASAEYCGSFGLGLGCVPADDQFLTTLYQRALGRQPDLGGYNYYLQLMANGMTHAQVVAAIIASGEFQSDHLAFIYSFCPGYANPLAFTTSVSAVGGAETPVTVTYSDNMGSGDILEGWIQIGAVGSLSWDNSGNVVLYTTNGPVSGSVRMGSVLTGSTCSIDLAHSSIAPAAWNADALVVTMAVTFSELSSLGLQEVQACGFDVYWQATPMRTWET